MTDTLSECDWLVYEWLYFDSCVSFWLKEHNLKGERKKKKHLDWMVRYYWRSQEVEYIFTNTLVS